MRKTGIFIGYILLIIVALSMLFPFFAMINLAFTNEDEIFKNTGVFFHANLTFDNFRHIFG